MNTARPTHLHRTYTPGEQGKTINTGKAGEVHINTTSLVCSSIPEPGFSLFIKEPEVDSVRIYRGYCEALSVEFVGINREEISACTRWIHVLLF